MLWVLAGVRSTRKALPLSNERLARFGVTRQSKDRALARLEGAGLVDIQRRAHSSPRVSLLTTTKRGHER